MVELYFEHIDVIHDTSMGYVIEVESDLYFYKVEITWSWKKLEWHRKKFVANRQVSWLFLQPKNLPLFLSLIKILQG